MGYKNPQELAADPDFWAPETTDAHRSAALSIVDPKFKAADQATQAKLLEGLKKRNMEGQRIAQKEIAGAEQNQSVFNQYIAQPLNNIVGRAMEVATTPAVAGVRMAQGVPMGEAFNQAQATEGAGGEAKRSREQAASAIVPQEPWQAALYAAGPVGRSVGKAAPALSGVMGRVGTAAALGGAAELAGGNMEDSALSRTLKGAGKAGAASGAVEALSGLSGWAARSPLFGGGNRMAKDNVGKLGGNIRKESADLNPPKEPDKFGAYFEKGGAQADMKKGMDKRMAAADDLVWNGLPPVKSDKVAAALAQLKKMYKGKAGFEDQLAELEPIAKSNEFFPSQVNKIMARLREAYVGSGNEKMSGHMAQEAMDAILEDAVRGSHPDVAKALVGARQAFSTGSGLRDLMEGVNVQGPKGYTPDMRKLQANANTPPDPRISGPGHKALNETIYRGSKKEGAQDWYPGPNQYMPYASGKGIMMWIARHLSHGNKYAGNAPFTAPAGQRGALGALLGAGASATSKKVSDSKEE